MVASLETVSLYYYLDHQPSNRQHKINGFGTAAHTVTNVKVTNDMRQTITLPWDADIDKANVAVIKSKVYDITDIRAATLAGNKSMEMDLLYNPVSTMMKTGDTVYGIWDRTPSIQHKAFNVDIADDTLKTSRTIALPKLRNGVIAPSFYYQITAKYNLTTKASSSSLHLYGGFAAWDTYCMTDDILSIYQINTDDSAHKYPMISEIINDIDTVIGLPPSSIVDVSISSRCPWKVKVETEYVPSIYSIMNGTVEVTPIDLSATRGIIELGGSGADITTDFATTTITLTDFERYCGRVQVCDNLGNVIHEIPTDYFDSNNQLTYSCGGVADYGGLFTKFSYGDVVVIWPEGKIPWITDSWNEYQAYTLSYDRQILANAIKESKDQTQINKQNALANGMVNMAYAGMMGGMSIVGGNPPSMVGLASTAAGIITTGLSTGIQMYTANKQGELDRRSLYAAQNAKEALMKNQPSSYYQVGYGVDYLNRSVSQGAKIKILTPANMTSTDYTNYIAYQGYPCGKYASFSLTTGVLKGTMYSTPNDSSLPRGNGPEMDALRKEIALGVRLV